MRALAAVAALLASLAVAPAQAQDGSEGTAQRTPESAQRFLSEFFAQGGFDTFVNVRVEGDALVPFRWTENGRTFAFGSVQRWTATGRCNSRVDIGNIRTISEGPGYGLPPQSIAIDIDWSKVLHTSVEPARTFQVRAADGSATSRTYFGIAASVRDREFVLPGLVFVSKEDADRVGFALDFLRRECGFKSDTGF